jgi:hypothetical protein
MLAIGDERLQLRVLISGRETSMYLAVWLHAETGDYDCGHRRERHRGADAGRRGEQCSRHGDR